MNSTCLSINNYSMSKFNNILENHLDTTNLSRIRIMFDPANESDKREEYIGYVLEENDTGVIAIVPQLGPETFELTPDQYEMDTTCGKLTSFKKFVVKFLMERGYHDKVTEHMDTIINSETPQELESILGSCGCDATVVLNIYRDYVSHE